MCLFSSGCNDQHVLLGTEAILLHVALPAATISGDCNFVVNFVAQDGLAAFHVGANTKFGGGF
jgi:hypothetical protein